MRTSSVQAPAIQSDPVVREVPSGKSAAWKGLLANSLTAECVHAMWEEAAGWRMHRLGLYENDQLVAGLVVNVRRIPATPWSFARIPCLMLDPARARKHTGALLAGLDRFCQDLGVLEIDFRLHLPADGPAAAFAAGHAVEAAIAAAGYQALPGEDGTFLIDIQRSDEELLASFNKNNRTQIRRALRADVVVEEDSTPARLDEFFAAYEAMTARKELDSLPRGHIVDGLRPLLEAGHARLYVARYGDVVADMTVTDVLGVPTYMLAVRALTNLDGAHPPAARALHYRIMGRLRDEGHAYYDLGGSPGPAPREGHPNYGVWRYKASYRGTFIWHLPRYRKARSGLVRKLLLPVHRLTGT